jgi:hypothetical protein
MSDNTRTYTVSIHQIFPFICAINGMNANSLGSDISEDEEHLHIKLQFENADDLLMFELKYRDIYHHEQ